MGVLKSRPTDRKATGSLLPSRRFKKDHGVAVMSIVIELLVLLGKKKNVYCIDDILPKKRRRKFQKRCTFHSSIIVFHNNIKLLLWQPNVAITKVRYFCK